MMRWLHRYNLKRRELQEGGEIRWDAEDMEFVWMRPMGFGPDKERIKR